VPDPTAKQTTVPWKALSQPTTKSSLPDWMGQPQSTSTLPWLSKQNAKTQLPETKTLLPPDKNYAGNLQKVTEAAQKRKQKELEEPPVQNDADAYGYSEAFKKLSQQIAKLPKNLKPEDVPGVRKN